MEMGLFVYKAAAQCIVYVNKETFAKCVKNDLNSSRKFKFPAIRFPLDES